jgi:hypothetical protein
MFDAIHNLLHWLLDPLEKALNSLGLGFPEYAAILFVAGVLITIPWANIYMRAGYPPLKGLLMFVPVLNIYLFFKFAFGEEWPIEREYAKASRSVQDLERALHRGK